MTVDVFKGQDEINGHKINRDYDKCNPLDNWNEKPIYIDEIANMITFMFKPHPEAYGCGVETLMKVALEILKAGNEVMSCAENKSAIFHVDTALQCLSIRDQRREEKRLQDIDKKPHSAVKGEKIDGKKLHRRRNRWD